jgi:hypothetical protein
VIEPKNRNEILNEISTNSHFDGALLRSLTGALYSNQINYNKTQQLICKEIFMTFPVVIYLAKDFYLTEAINEKITYLQASGLIEYWHSQIIDPRYHNVQESKQPKGIKIEHLSGCFYIWMMSLLFSCLIFLFEVMNQKFSWKFVRRNRRKRCCS